MIRVPAKPRGDDAIRADTRLPGVRSACLHVPNGFTLIELLVVTAIIGLVIAAIGACLAGGIRAWDAARRFNRVESEALLGLRVVERDIANTFLFLGIPFRGGADEVSFPILTTAPVGGGGSGEVRVLGTVRYRLDRAAEAVMREVSPYGTDEPEEDGSRERLISGVQDLRWQFYAPPANRGATGTWRDAWDSRTNFPAAVRIELNFSGRDAGRVDRTVVLPVTEAR